MSHASWMVSSRSALLFGLGAFLLNPSYACSGEDPEYQYGGAELRAAVEGDWALSISRSSAPALELTVHLEQGEPLAALLSTPSLLQTAHACGTRTLLASARACVDATEMPLRVSFVSGEPSLQGAELGGNFRVDSLVFDVGILYLALGELRVTAQVDADGNVSSTTVEAPTPASSVSLVRFAR